MRLGRAPSGPEYGLWSFHDNPLPALRYHLFSDPFVAYPYSQVQSPSCLLFFFFFLNPFQFILSFISPLAGPDPSPSDLFLPLEEVQELLATLEGLPGEARLPLELRTEKPGEQSEETTLKQEEESPTLAPVALSTGLLEEEAALQLVIHRSLESQSQVADEREATALRRALALSLLEAEETLGDDPGGRAHLVVHTSFEQDMDELNRALTCALEEHLREETVNLQGCTLPSELGARLERCHDVSVTLRGDRIVLRGFGVQPARAARHLAALLIGPWDQNLTFALEASENNRKSVPRTWGW